jgi:hypothetical protein
VTDRDRAAERLDAFLARMDRLGLEDLRLISLPLPDPDDRGALLAVVDRAAAVAGRTDLVDDARRKARKAIVGAYARHQYDPTWAGLNWGRSLGTANERVGLALAVEDAAVASVMQDLLDDEAVSALTERFELAAGMTGSTTTPSLSLGRGGAAGWLARVVFGVMVILVGVAIGVAQAALALITSILLLRRRGGASGGER